MGCALDDVQRWTGVWQGLGLNLTSSPLGQDRLQLSRVPQQHQETGQLEQTEWGQHVPPEPRSAPPLALGLDSADSAPTSPTALPSAVSFLLPDAICKM